MSTVETIRSAHKAATILAHPLRSRILAAARQPISAAGLARQLGDTRQRINYHVRQLAAAGFLEQAGQQRKRNMVEQQYVASAGAYLLAADVLGEAAAVASESADSSSATHLLALYARAQTEVAGVVTSAQQAGLRVRTFALDADVHFENAQQRADFTKALADALHDVVARYQTRKGNRFRLVVGCYPAG